MRCMSCAIFAFYYYYYYGTHCTDFSPAAQSFLNEAQLPHSDQMQDFDDVGGDAVSAPSNDDDGDDDLSSCNRISLFFATTFLRVL
jgi:hypothetical protein